MKNYIHYCLIGIATFATISSFGQGTAAPTQLQMLMQLQGSWQSNDATMKADGKSHKFVYTADFKTTADNSGLTMSEVADIPEVVRMIGSNLIGVSAVDGKIHWFSVDNTGTAHDHIGEFSDGKHFSMVYRGMQDGKEFVETVSLELTSKDAMNLKLMATSGGKEVTQVYGTFMRKR